MEENVGYAIILCVFCVFSLIAVGIIFFAIRATRKKSTAKPSHPASQPAPQTLQAQHVPETQKTLLAAQPPQAQQIPETQKTQLAAQAPQTQQTPETQKTQLAAQTPQEKLVQLANAAEQSPDLRAQMRANMAAPAVANKGAGEAVVNVSANKPAGSLANIQGKAGTIAPVYLTLSSQPRSILQGMDNLVAKARTVNAARQRWKLLPRLGFFAGLGMIAIDVILFLFGYSSCVFSTGGLAIWVAAFVLSRYLKRQQTSEFPAGYQTAREIIHTLRDDLKPGSPLLGHLDLTGYNQKEKIARSTTDTMNRTTQHYRDEWLSLKAKLYDGNVLRVSAVQRAKVRNSYWKRSSFSGKNKLKPEKFKGSLNELKVRIVVNPEMYTIAPDKQVTPGKSIGQYKISQVDTEGGMINLAAYTTADEIQPESILNLLHHTYALLQRKAA